MMAAFKLALLLSTCFCASHAMRVKKRVNGTLAPLPEPSAVDRHGMLSVNGNKIVDKSGAPVRLKGMSMFWSQIRPQFWNGDVVDWLKKDWKVTLVRAAMGVDIADDLPGYLQNPPLEKARMEAVVDACIAAGLYVVIDWHDHHAEDHLEEAKAFFDEMARKYGGYPNVLFELYNEPVHSSWADVIKPYHEAIIPVIRQHSQNIIILGTRHWSQDVDEASRDPVVGENLAYTVHFYANTHRQGLRDKVSTALANGVAIFASEWGTCDASGNGDLDLRETQAWLNFFEENHISDANWAIGDKAEACAAMKPGANHNGGWSMGDLTESGRFVRAQLRDEKLPGPELPIPEPRQGCCKWGDSCGDCGEDGSGWCHHSAGNCGACAGQFDEHSPQPQCN